MLNNSSEKKGYTLVEVLVVVSIIGVLSSLGVVSLRDAVINSRMKDCALNTAAFLERIANESNRMSKKICVMKKDDQKLWAYVTDKCEDSFTGDPYATFEIESPAKFSCNDAIQNEFEGDNWNSKSILFVPRIGLSAIPPKGFLCMQYGNSETNALVLKQQNNNMIIPMWRNSGSPWIRL